MNKTYKVIWSKVRNCYVAVSEIAKRNGKDRTSVTGGAAGSRQAARVLCALLLGAYLTAGYSMPVAWASPDGDGATIQGQGTSAGGTLASAWGRDTRAVGFGSTAWGDGAIAGDTNNPNNVFFSHFATAWGIGTVASGTGSTAWGHWTTASGVYATAWGSGFNFGSIEWKTIASGDYSTAFGFWTEASGQSATAWGGYSRSGTETYHGGTASGEASTAFGVSTTANTLGSTAWGSGTIAGNDGTNSGTYATAWGYQSIAAGKYATAWGGYGGTYLGGKASGEASTAFGVDTTANTEGSTAWGYKTTAGSGTININGVDTTPSGLYATAWGGPGDFGVGPKALGHYATAWGEGTIASGEYNATAFGYGTKATERGSTAWGRTATASGRYSTAFGNNSEATESGAVAWGGYHDNDSNNYKGGTASGKASTAFGIGTTANTEGSTAWGYKSQAKGNYSTAFGGDGTDGTISTANATNSLAALGGTTAESATNSAAIGKGATASLADTVALGSGSVASTSSGVEGYLYGGSNTGNAWKSTHNAIAVGNGSTVTRQITGVAAGTEDTDAVNVAQLTAAVNSAGGGTAYTAGDGIAIDDTTKAISVKANTDDFEFDSTTKALTIKKGTVASGNTGLVTGGSVFTAIQAETRVSSDGNYIQTANSAAANLSALDTQVKTNTDAIGDANSGLVKKVNDNTTAIGTKANAADVYTITAADAKFAMLDALNLSAENVTAWSTKLGTGSVASGNTGLVTGGTVFTAIQTETRVSSDGNYIQAANSAAANLSALDTKVKANADALAGKADAATTYTQDAADAKFAMLDASNINATTWASKLGTGTVASSSANLITGKTVYTEVRPVSDGTYVKKANTTAANLKALDTQVKANADAIEDKADASVVSELTDMVGANEKAIEKNANDISSLGTKVTANETALAKKADKANTLKGYGIEDAYTKEETDTLLNKKADKTALAEVKATADSNKEALAALGDVKELAKDTETIKKIADDVETVVSEQNGVVADGKVEEDANELVRGATVYDFLNGESLVIGEKTRKIAVGSGSAAMGNQSIAIGFGNKVSGNNSGAFGDPNNISGDGSYAVGNNNTISGNNTFVLGSNVTADVDDAVVLGNKSTAESGAVSVGSDGSERQIKHVADGTDDADAATVGQMNRAIEDAVGTNMVNMSNSINKLDSRINKVGAGAAALAALHPIDTDDKFTMGLGYGNYRSAHSAAIGMFYRPTETIMLSVGGAMGNGENMINAGISFALDKGKGFGTSKAAMARKIAAQGEEIQSLKAENAEIKEQNAKLAERLAAIEAKLGK